MLNTLSLWQFAALAILGAFTVFKLTRRLELSLAKHPSLLGHSKMLRFFTKFVPYYRLEKEDFFVCDGADKRTGNQREAAFFELAERLKPDDSSTSELLRENLSDVDFTNRYRIPYQFADLVGQHLGIDGLVSESAGTQIKDSSGRWLDDLSGSYGVNLFGYDFYKECMSEAATITDKLGPVLGPYHPIILDVSNRLKEISGLDEVSFHMSGTEAVMQAVRLARYHTGKQKTVQFCGAYHGWWDGVQPGLGNSRKVRDVLTLSELSQQTLRVLSQRKDIACVLINPLQAMHPNRNAPGDGTLLLSRNLPDFDKEQHTKWLQDLRAVCDRKNIPLIFDEVFVGFRLAKGGAQEFFGVQADLVTYGKTLGGGFPVGVLCGKTNLMKRYKPTQPANISFARGTFNSHPSVLGAMQAFLDKLDEKDKSGHYDELEALWNDRADYLNKILADLSLPIRISNMVSIWAVSYTRPGRFHWLFQYYLRANGIALGWIGTGKMIFSHNFDDAAFQRVCTKFVTAAQEMQADGWLENQQTNPPRHIRRRLLQEYVNALFARSNHTA